MREDERECRRFVGTMLCVYTAVVIASGLETWRCTDQNQLADVLAEFLCPVVLPRLTRESCIEKVQPAREEECSNSDMLSTMTRSCTLYIPAHLPSVHSPDQVWCLFFSSLSHHRCARSAMAREKIHGTL